MTNNNHYMLVVSLLIFATPFLAAHWLDSRKIFLAKGGPKETRPELALQPPLPIARDLTRELLTTWMISSTVWVLFAIEHILGSCNHGPDGFSCLIGGNNWILQTDHFGWRDVFRISLFLAAFPVVGLLVGTATLWVLTGFARPEDCCDRD
jgi:hypothetical protein